jgi:dihydrofolate reductase
MISLIAAMSTNHVIGVNNQLPWHLPADFKHFKQLTLNKPIIMGRKTFESIGRPLPKRRNIIISRQEDYHADGCDVFTSIEAALEATQDEPEVMIIGGATLYEQTLPFADRLYLTIVDITLEGDAYFPKWSNNWNIIDEVEHSRDEKNSLDFRFLTLEPNGA